MVKVFQSKGFSGSRFFQGQQFSGLRFVRVRVQVLQLAMKKWMIWTFVLAKIISNLVKCFETPWNVDIAFTYMKNFQKNTSKWPLLNFWRRAEYLVVSWYLIRNSNSSVNFNFKFRIWMESLCSFLRYIHINFH